MSITTSTSTRNSVTEPGSAGSSRGRHHLSATAQREVGGLLHPGGATHPWQRRRVSVGWGTRETIDHRPVVPDTVGEFAGDTPVDEGRYRYRVQVPSASVTKWMVVLPW
ncbi:hypothetical protein [Streptomyces sp. NPDC018610]|uniref:hypothetical protein n=1 Tax=Streptomyces sp. NPDC018610 TaxID=3365049 RepID=UPI0037AA0A7E